MGLYLLVIMLNAPDGRALGTADVVSSKAECNVRKARIEVAFSKPAAGYTLRSAECKPVNGATNGR